MLTLLMSFCLATSQVKADEAFQIEEDNAKIADLIRDHDVCSVELNVCEESLDKALNKQVETSFFQDPMVITGSVLTALVVGIIIGSTQRGN